METTLINYDPVNDPDNVRNSQGLEETRASIEPEGPPPPVRKRKGKRSKERRGSQTVVKEIADEVHPLEQDAYYKNDEKEIGKKTEIKTCDPANKQDDATEEEYASPSFSSNPQTQPMYDDSSTRQSVSVSPTTPTVTQSPVPLPKHEQHLVEDKSPETYPSVNRQGDNGQDDEGEDDYGEVDSSIEQSASGLPQVRSTKPEQDLAEDPPDMIGLSSTESHLSSTSFVSIQGHQGTSDDDDFYDEGHSAPRQDLRFTKTETNA